MHEMSKNELYNLGVSQSCCFSNVMGGNITHTFKSRRQLLYNNNITHVDMHTVDSDNTDWLLYHSQSLYITSWIKTHL